MSEQHSTYGGNNRGGSTTYPGEMTVSSTVSEPCIGDDHLTPEQIANWREVLCSMIGPYALIMPDADIQQYRDQMQARADEIAKCEGKEAQG